MLQQNHVAMYLHVQIVKFKLPSEEKDNPIDEIRFYKKPKGSNNNVELLTKDEVEEMVRNSGMNT